MGRYDVVQQKYTLVSCLASFMCSMYIGNGCGLRDYVTGYDVYRKLLKSRSPGRVLWVRCLYLTSHTGRSNSILDLVVILIVIYT